MKDILKMLSGGDFQSGVYAGGGSLQAHGIKEGDTFLSTISGTIQKVKDKNGKIVYINLSNGERDSQPPLPFKNGGALLGNQKRIDMNKNEKIDAEDFKLLRSSMNGAWRNERKHVNHNEDYEIRYARKKPSRTGYKGKRKFGEGGGVEEKYVYKTNNRIFADDLLKYADLQNIEASSKKVGSYYYVTTNKKIEARRSMTKELAKIVEGKKFKEGGGVSKSMQSKKMFFGGGLKKTSTLKKYENFEGKIVITKDEKVFKVISQDKDMVEVINPNLLGTGVRPTSINISEINKIV